MIRESFQIAIASHRQILNTIRMQREISGAELARLSNLQPSTLVYILRSLKSKGLIRVSHYAAKSGTAGKPPTLWELAPDIGYIIGLEIIPNEVRATVIDFQCNVVHQEHIIGIDNVSPEKIIYSIDAFLKGLLKNLGIKKNAVIGLGIALTGLVDRESGIVHFSRKLELQNFPIAKLLQEKLRLPIEVVNDANAGALGIKWHVGDDVNHHAHVVFLTLNEKTGYFGAGLILNETLYEGVNGTAGEIYNPLPNLNSFIEKAVEKLGENHPILHSTSHKENVDIEDIISCAQKGCALSLEILDQYAELIIAEILQLIQLLNPSLIIVGGDITDARELIFQTIVNRVGDRLQQIFPFGLPAPEIQFSRFGIYSVSLGATALILRHIFV